MNRVADLSMKYHVGQTNLLSSDDYCFLCCAQKHSAKKYWLEQDPFLLERYCILWVCFLLASWVYLQLRVMSQRSIHIPDFPSPRSWKQAVLFSTSLWTLNGWKLIRWYHLRSFLGNHKSCWLSCKTSKKKWMSFSLRRTSKLLSSTTTTRSCTLFCDWVCFLMIDCEHNTLQVPEVACAVAVGINFIVTWISFYMLLYIILIYFVYLYIYIYSQLFWYDEVSHGQPCNLARQCLQQQQGKEKHFVGLSRLAKGRAGPPLDIKSEIFRDWWVHINSRGVWIWLTCTCESVTELDVF